MKIRRARKQIQVDGQAFGGTAFELDGTDNQDPILGIIVINPAMDAVTETKITTQNFDAELGKAVSAVVTAQTRSGTNNFHGSVYDFRTGNANLARDPYSQAPRSTATVPPGLKNRFGGSIGGSDPQGQGRSSSSTMKASAKRWARRPPIPCPPRCSLNLPWAKHTSAAQLAAGYPGADFSEYADDAARRCGNSIYDAPGRTPWQAAVVRRFRSLTLFLTT